MSFARIFGAQPALPAAHIVHVEADVGKGLHQFNVVGLPDKAVEESRDRVASAIKNSGYKSPKHSNLKIVISLAPAALKKEGAAFDLPMALAYLRAAEEVTFSADHVLFAGELALDGSLRTISGALSLAQAAKRAGFKEIVLPEGNADEAALVEGLTVRPAATLRDVVLHLTKPTEFLLSSRVCAPTPDSNEHLALLDEIRGQEGAKRALEIAAAGEHNIAFYGPPGTGKTMLARALASLLPPLTHDDMLEVTTIHSVAGILNGTVQRHPPFRSPHHTSSYAAIIGGGAVPRPGEVTLAHRGVLFLDEFPEFHRDVINALREPLEDRVVSVSRAKASHVFPARFMLVAALNPCPCGFAGSNRCTCMPVAIEKYRKKISGPIADRIDMWVHVGEIAPEALSVHTKRVAPHETASARARIIQARNMQHTRFSTVTHAATNASMKARDIESLAQLSANAERVLVDATRKLRLSSRGYHRTIKLARTIADLAHAVTIEPEHMLEALQYRQRD
ncbi:MAG: YifB family Mg chelatase-like AAA ATPase [Candidatus Pacebacteria bacterium]|nr:YifB family Mg chelatase-like AAA ATPase [Candidatus Paceibacterota bacterium]